MVIIYVSHLVNQSLTDCLDFSQAAVTQVGPLTLCLGLNKHVLGVEAM